MVDRTTIGNLRYAVKEYTAGKSQCAVKRRVLSVGGIPTRQLSLQHGAGTAAKNTPGASFRVSAEGARRSDALS